MIFRRSVIMRWLVFFIFKYYACLSFLVRICPNWSIQSATRLGKYILAPTLLSNMFFPHVIFVLIVLNHWLWLCFYTREKSINEYFWMAFYVLVVKFCQFWHILWHLAKSCNKNRLFLCTSKTQTSYYIWFKHNN